MLVSSTSNPDNVKRLERTTEYQIYSPSTEKVIDFTERKLKKFIEQAGPADKIVVAILLDDYRRGRVAVGWKKGKPVWLKVKSEAG